MRRRTALVEPMTARQLVAAVDAAGFTVDDVTGLAGWLDGWLEARGYDLLDYIGAAAQVRVDSIRDGRRAPADLCDAIAADIEAHRPEDHAESFWRG